MKIYIAGASGQLGSYLKYKLKNKKNIKIYTKRYNLLLKNLISILKN